MFYVLAAAAACLSANKSNPPFMHFTISHNCSVAANPLYFASRAGKKGYFSNSPIFYAHVSDLNSLLFVPGNRVSAIFGK